MWLPRMTHEHLKAGTSFRCHTRLRLRGCCSTRLHLPPLWRVVEHGIDALKGRSEIAAKFLELLRQSRLTRYEHIVAARPSVIPDNAAKRLPQTSPDPVSHHRIADLLCHREAEAGPADDGSIIFLCRSGCLVWFVFRQFCSMSCGITGTCSDKRSWPRFHEKAGSAEANAAPDAQEFGTLLEGNETSCSRAGQTPGVLRPTTFCGPWPAGVRGREHRRSSPSACGSHGGVCGQAGSVGMYVSRLVSENLGAARQGLNPCASGLTLRARLQNRSGQRG